MNLLLAVLFALANESLPRPVAMVLRADVGATLRRGGNPARPLRDMDLLRDGYVLRTGKQEALVVFTGDGHSERILAGKTVTVHESGCQPKAATVRLASARREAAMRRRRMHCARRSASRAQMAASRAASGSG